MFSNLSVRTSQLGWLLQGSFDARDIFMTIIEGPVKENIRYVVHFLGLKAIPQLKFTEGCDLCTGKINTE